MSFWLLKSEPEDFSWCDMVACNVTKWDNVRNYQAQSNLRKMKMNDLAFFYHSGKEKAIVGIVSIYKEYYQESIYDKFGVVDVKFYMAFKEKVSLLSIKSNCDLQSMAILKQPRLSVSPVTDAERNAILQIVGVVL